ncbi:MAG: RNA polymerase sigma factor RpoD/SigA [bacterium]
MKRFNITKTIGFRESLSLEKYLREIGKISLITQEEEVQLAVKIHMGDQRALEKLVKANLRFVVSVAKQYQHQGLSLSDLINEGNLGLIKAAQRFDETKGFKFISYAVWWIRQSILQALAEQGRLVRLPQNKIGTYNKASEAFTAFEQENEREPSTEELANILDMSETEVTNIFTSNTRHISLDEPILGLDDITNEDVIIIDNYNDDEVKNEDLRIDIDRALKTLTQYQRDVISSFFKLKNSLTKDEVCQKYNITEKRFREAKDKTLQILRRRQYCCYILKKYI